MKKLVLDLAALEVESFDAAPMQALRATVHARQDSFDGCPISADESACTCPGVGVTCDRICPDSAYVTCSRFCGTNQTTIDCA